jgi:hypothetical protein
VGVVLLAQAKWYLNGFWGAAEKEAENVWKFTQKFIELDKKGGKNGSSLDEFMVCPSSCVADRQRDASHLTYHWCCA